MRIIMWISAVGWLMVSVGEAYHHDLIVAGLCAWVGGHDLAAALGEKA